MIKIILFFILSVSSPFAFAELTQFVDTYNTRFTLATNTDSEDILIFDRFNNQIRFEYVSESNGKKYYEAKNRKNCAVTIDSKDEVYALGLGEEEDKLIYSARVVYVDRNKNQCFLKTGHPPRTAPVTGIYVEMLLK